MALCRLALIGSMFCVSLSVWLRATERQAAAGSRALECAQQAVGSTGLTAFTLDGTLVVAQKPDGTGFSQGVNLKYLAPGNYLRTDRRKFAEGFVNYLFGFTGQRLLNDVRAEGAGMNFGSSWGPEQLGIERRDAALMLLALLAVMPEDVALEPGESVVPGRSSVVRGEVGGRRFSLSFSPECEPVRLTYSASVRIPGATPSVGGPPPATMAEMQVVVHPRRRVDGVAVPLELLKQVNGFPLERLTITGFKKNPTLSLKDFLPGAK